MDQDNGIITVSGQDEQAEDEALIALRKLPRFEPLVVPDTPSHFSLASVFGALSTSPSGSKRDSSVATDVTFNPDILVDIFLQMNTHSKKCALDIQQFQRSLAQKMKSLDDSTTEAVQELGAVQHQAKTHADQLLSVHAIAKQAQVTKLLLHTILDKVALISNYLPAEETDGDGPSSSFTSSGFTCPYILDTQGERYYGSSVKFHG
ncbi:hypothetical protein BGZ83_010262 [Gryganskiella cystojenkinii]|nr:hypothetical protein BGZ83_010262 [Gryganskiella cystojenkinii]